MQSYNVNNAPDMLGPFVVPVGVTEVGVATYRRQSTEPAGSYKFFQIYLANGPGRWVVYFPGTGGTLSREEIIALILALG